VLIYAFPLTMKGFRLRMAITVVSEDIRWHRCDIKSISLIANVRANEDAHSQGADENIFHRNGLMTEGSHTSLFLVRDGVVYTHPETPLILPGITRRIVIDLCHELEIPVREKAVPVEELAQMDEVFLTGTTAQVLAVGTIRNGMAACTPGDQATPVTRRIQDAFLRRVQEQTGRSLL
jgi:D-alanine transaminase